MNRLLLFLTPDLQTWALRLERYTRERWRGAVLSATGVGVGTLLCVDHVHATLETHIAWSMADLAAGRGSNRGMKQLIDLNQRTRRQLSGVL